MYDRRARVSGMSRAILTTAKAAEGKSQVTGSDMLRSCTGRFATGVCVVSFGTPHGHHGLTINSFTSVSLSPALVLVSIGKKARAHESLPGEPFCVNVLGAEQEEYARRFAGAPTHGEVHWDESGLSPRLFGALAHIDCSPWRTYDGGDHTLVLGEVESIDYRDGDALGYFNGRFVRIDAPTRGIEFLF